MDFRTKYYRPNLAKGTAGAAKTTPTPIRRSATKWAMPVEGGGNGGEYPIMDIKVSGTNAEAINAALAEYMPLEEAGEFEVHLQDTEVRNDYVITVTPGANYYCATPDVDPAGKGEPITFNATAEGGIIELAIMAATKIDGSDMIPWDILITGNDE